MDSQNQERILNAILWLRNKDSEYMDKVDNLCEIAEIIGKENVQKCEEFYLGKVKGFSEAADVLEMYLDFEGIHSGKDIMAEFYFAPDDPVRDPKTLVYPGNPVTGKYKGLTFDEAKKMANQAYKFYQDHYEM